MSIAGALKPGRSPLGDYFGRPGADPADGAYLMAGILQPASALRRTRRPRPGLAIGGSGRVTTDHRAGQARGREQDR
jgi:hypothetical protein